LTEGGEKPIEQIHAGDTVVSTDPILINTLTQKVSQVFVRTSPVLVDITVAGILITCTPEHPFWVPGVGWIKAGALVAGDKLQTEAGAAISIDSLRRREGAFIVYNLEVENVHSYYVSDLHFLVHNQYGRGPFNPDQSALVDLAKGAKRTGVTPQDAQTLRDWAREYKMPSRGPECHPGRPFGQYPHIHVGPVDHIPVR
jgi:hypothetical protein